MQAIILGSVDGQEWAHVILYPGEGTPDLGALASLLDDVQKSDDDWEWGDMIPVLQQAGYIVPRFYHGPMWDQINN